ncbi:MAG: LacI family DNA-binding transcriptional regulator [Bacteroidota bacterium]
MDKKGRKRGVTIRDIARELNVTPSTVSRALNGSPRISTERKEEVLAVAKQLNYRPNQLATSLRTGKGKMLGVMVPTTDRSFFSSVIRGIEEEASAAGYSVMICQSHDLVAKEKQNIASFLGAQVDAVLASLAMEKSKFTHYERITEENTPLVLFDRITDNISVNKIIINDFSGAKKVMHHLFEQGYTRIAHLAGPQQVALYAERVRGYKAALAEKEIPFDPDLCIECTQILAEGYRAAQKLMGLAHPPDAIFASGDYAAMGAMQYLQERQIKIPEEIGIAGFSNESFTSLVNPSITTVDQHSLQMGITAAKLALSLAESPVQTAQTTVLEPSLIIRNSSKRKPEP